MIENNYKETALAYGFICAVCGAIFLYGLFCQRVPDNGSGADTVRTELNTAREQQQVVDRGIADTQKTADSIAKSSSNIEHSVDKLETGIRNSGELIADCQRIVGQVRARGPAED